MRFDYFFLCLMMAAVPAWSAVKLTAIQVVSTDAAGKIPGVGGHRFRTTLHGGHPGIFLVKGEELDGAILNGPKTANNDIASPMTVGTHTYTMLAERSNSYTWTNYTLQLFFDQSRSAQISALTALNVNSTQYFPPFGVNPGLVEDLGGYPGKSPGTLVFKSGRTEVRLTAFHFSDPTLFKQDRVGPFEAKANRIMENVGQFTLEVTAPPELSAGGVVNGASFAAKVAPGALISLFGTDLAVETMGASALPLPRQLGGTSVTIGGKAAPLVYVSAGQINAQVPYEVAEGAAVPVVVTVNGEASTPGSVSVVAAAPGIFQFGQRRAVVQNADYSVNTAENGAAVDSYVVAYLTGAGQVDNGVASGSAAKGDPISRPRSLVTATLNGAPVEVVFAGLTPEFVGLMQVNFKVPGLAPGTYALVVTANGEKSNAAMVTIK